MALPAYSRVDVDGARSPTVPAALPSAASKPEWDGKAKDVVWAALFVVHIAVVLLLARACSPNDRTASELAARRDGRHVTRPTRALAVDEQSAIGHSTHPIIPLPAVTLGIPAVAADGAVPTTGPSAAVSGAGTRRLGQMPRSCIDGQPTPVPRPHFHQLSHAGALDLNAALLLRVLASAVGAAAIVSLTAFGLLRRLGGAVIRAARYSSFAFLLISSIALMSINIIAGIFMLLVCCGVLAFMQTIEKHIPFAAAHLQVRSACGVRSNCLRVAEAHAQAPTRVIYGCIIRRAGARLIGMRIRELCAYARPASLACICAHRPRRRPHPASYPCRICACIPNTTVTSHFTYCVAFFIVAPPPHTHITLQAACDATAEYPSLFLTAMLLLGVLAVWQIVFAFAALGVEHALQAS